MHNKYFVAYAEISKNDMNLNCENFNIEYLNLNPAFDIQQN